MAHVQGASRVGGDKLHLDLLALAIVVTTVLPGVVENGVNHLKGTGCAHEKVDKTGACNLNFLDSAGVRQPFHQCLCQLSWRATRRLRCDQSNVAGVVTVGFVLGVAYLWCKGLICWQGAFRLQGRQRRLEQFGYGLFHAVG